MRAALLFVAACAHAPPPEAPPFAPPPFVSPSPSPPPVAIERGLATWYGKRLANHRTASGERFDPSKMTAAHRTLPFGTKVEVRRAGTERVVIVRINDRGPFGDEQRIIDLSSAAFERLGSTREGVIRVELRVLP